MCIRIIPVRYRAYLASFSYPIVAFAFYRKHVQFLVGSADCASGLARSDTFPGLLHTSRMLTLSLHKSNAMPPKKRCT